MMVRSRASDTSNAATIAVHLSDRSAAKWATFLHLILEMKTWRSCKLGTAYGSVVEDMSGLTEHNWSHHAVACTLQKFMT